MVQSKVGRWKLLLAGEGPLKNTLEQSFAHVSGVEWLGRVPHEEMLRHCAESRWLIVSSTWYEMGPLVGLEAISVGTPVIVPDIGSMPSLVATGAGFVFDNERPGALVEALSQAIGMDEQSWNRMSQDALLGATTTYSPENAYKLLLNAYGLAEAPDPS